MARNAEFNYTYPPLPPSCSATFPDSPSSLHFPPFLHSPPTLPPPSLLSPQVSDDEDDTHPNVDTASLFRWRHQARMERMEKAKEEKEEFTKKTTE